jgi:phage-related protein
MGEACSAFDTAPELIVTVIGPPVLEATIPDESAPVARASLPSRREARIFFGFHDDLLIAVHAMIKKTQKTPAQELALARQRFKELQLWPGKTPI